MDIDCVNYKIMGYMRVIHIVVLAVDIHGSFNRRSGRYAASPNSSDGRW
jgi:hypothetical protein